MTMNNDTYVENSGQMCPVCRSENIQADSMEADGGGAWCEVLCHDCQAEWVETYKLAGYMLKGQP